MNNETEYDDLDFSDKRVIVTKAAISAIPYVGGSLATLYTDFKTEKRLKNLESFYQELSETMRSFDNVNLSSNTYSGEELMTLIEKVNDQVENEFRESKINYLKNYMIKILNSTNPTPDFDISLYFVETLNQMTELECELLMLLSQQVGPIRISAISKPRTSQNLILGSIGKLKLFGFASTFTTNFVINGTIDNSLNESVELTDLGREFVHFCLEEPR